ncbi:hypothetical protein DYU11_28870 [Fibrisoma montanum]|uniref:Lipocalin-like domain-containing protein n=1 Tax=Fibrisoma montanum TaxID=2305895 RepID=A0A418LYH0_9BACT|nr:hypothetical protein [Fibrisoma montanum]RIV18255.1 hypothetical protein DYU11_28870 [Fibrisoma montanum]
MKTNRPKLAALTTFLVLIALSCERPVCGCVSPPAPVNGVWALTSITYGLTQKRVTASEAGYTETISYDGLVEAGTFKRLRNGNEVETGNFSLSFPNGGNTKGIVLYLNDKTWQSFEIRSDNVLYLSERSPHGTDIADGATYAYQKQ